MPPAARIGDYHTCPQWNGNTPHVGGPVTTGAYTVLIGGQPAGRVGDMLVCIGPPDVIAQGDSTVLIGGQPAARQGDRTAHGGVIVAGCPTVLIGTATAGASCLCEAAKNGTPFVDMGQPQPDAQKEGGGLLPSAAPSQHSKSPHSELGSGADKLLGKSPTLTKKLKDLKSAGWKIREGTAGNGTYADRSSKTISIDPNNKATPEQLTQTLSHEVGHAAYTLKPYVPPDGLTKQEYIDKNVKNNLDDEGEATLTNAKVRDEIIQNGGPDIGIAGNNQDKYEKIYNDYKKSGQRDLAREKIGDVFKNGEHPSNDPTKTYYDYYSKPYSDSYDQNTKAP